MSTPESERRSHPRRQSRLPGMVYIDGVSFEVDMIDSSTHGAGFISISSMSIDQTIHLKVGIGPSRRPRTVRVTRCERTKDGEYRVGVKFV